MVCLGHDDNERYKGILKLLGTLLVSAASAEDKQRILRDEFAIATDRDIDEKVLNMCNLSRGVEARGIKKGRIEGRIEGRSEGLREGLSKGRSEGVLASICNLMESMGWGITEAMNALRIPESERQGYINKLSQNRL